MSENPDANLEPVSAEEQREVLASFARIPKPTDPRPRMLAGDPRPA